MNYNNKRLLKLFAGLFLVSLIFTILPRVIFSSLALFASTFIWVTFFYIMYQIFGRRYISNYRQKQKYKKNKPQNYYSDRR